MVSGAYRPTARRPRAARRRPLSSSARVCRPTRSMRISPASDRTEGRHLPGDLPAQRCRGLGPVRPSRRRRRWSRVLAAAASSSACGRVETSTLRPWRRRARRPPSDPPQQHPAGPGAGTSRSSVPVPVDAQSHASPDPARARRRSAAGRAPRASAAGWSACGRRHATQRRRAPRRAARCRPRSATRLPSTTQAVHSGQRGRARSAAAPARPETDVRVRCRRLGQGAGLDDPARADDADPVAEPLDLRQDVAATAAPVCPRVAELARCTSWNTASISGSRPEVGSSRISSSTSEASAATSATFCRLPFE